MERIAQEEASVAVPEHHVHVTQRQAGSNVRKDIGVLMFLLAAETAVAGIAGGDGTTIPAAAAAVPQPKSLCASDSSSLGDTDSVASTRRTPSPDAEVDEQVEVFPQSTAITLSDATTIELVASYLPWRNVVKLRLVSAKWKEAADRIVTIQRLPGTTIHAPFLLTPKTLDQDLTTESSLLFSHPSTWRCVHCNFWNTETRVLCGNRQCQAPSLTHVGYTRIFVGQLRRDATVPFLQWLVDRVVEAPGQLRNVENHRHNITNRGKGCAWAYFKDERVAQQLLAFHRRIFLDVVDGVEGVWVVPEAGATALAAVAQERGYASQRPKCLPRNALVVELPATGCTISSTPLSNAEIERQYAVAPDEAEAPLPHATPSNPTAEPTPASDASFAPKSPFPRFHHNPYGGIVIGTEFGGDDAAESEWHAYYPPWAQTAPYYSSEFSPYMCDGEGNVPPPSYDFALSTDQDYYNSLYYTHAANVEGTPLPYDRPHRSSATRYGRFSTYAPTQYPQGARAHPRYSQSM